MAKSAYEKLDPKDQRMVENITECAWQTLIAREAGFSIHATSKIVKQPMHFVTSHTTALRALVTMQQAKQIHEAAQFLGMSISRLLVLSVQEKMEKVKKDTKAKPFVGSPATQAYEKNVKDRLKEALAESVTPPTPAPKKPKAKK